MNNQKMQEKLQTVSNQKLEQESIGEVKLIETEKKSEADQVKEINQNSGELLQANVQKGVNTEDNLKEENNINSFDQSIVKVQKQQIMKASQDQIKKANKSFGRLICRFKINNQIRQNHGTAFILGSRVVIAASHLLYCPETIFNSEIVFIPENQQNSEVQIKILYFWIDSEFKYSSEFQNQKGFDLAFFILQRNEIIDKNQVAKINLSQNFEQQLQRPMKIVSYSGKSQVINQILEASYQNELLLTKKQISLMNTQGLLLLQGAPQQFQVFGVYTGSINQNCYFIPIQKLKGKIISINNFLRKYSQRCNWKELRQQFNELFDENLHSLKSQLQQKLRIFPEQSCLLEQLVEFYQKRIQNLQEQRFDQIYKIKLMKCKLRKQITQLNQYFQRQISKICASSKRQALSASCSFERKFKRMRYQYDLRTQEQQNKEENLELIPDSRKLDFLLRFYDHNAPSIERFFNMIKNSQKYGGVSIKQWKSIYGIDLSPQSFYLIISKKYLNYLDISQFLTLPNWENLEYLKFKNINFDNDGWKLFADNCHGFKNVRILYMFFTNLCEVLETDYDKLQSLVKLNLCFNPLSSKSVDQLISLKTHRNIKINIDIDNQSRTL